MQATLHEHKPMSNLHFKMMTLSMKMRDLLRPRRVVLEEAHILPGFQVLDYGCGPGGYVPDASRRTGDSGKVYALDMHPLSIQRVTKVAKERQLTNVETIHSDCQTGLPAESIDLALLYDVFHALTNPDEVLTELHRVLKHDGHLSFSDHHLEHDEIIAGVTHSGLFRLFWKGKYTYYFAKCA